MKVHFVGAGGTGMSALAQMRAFSGDEVTGSDRLNDRGGLGEARARLEKAGIVFHPQDGSGLSRETGRVVVSTAVEMDNPDLLRAKELGLPVVHRAQELSELAASRRTIAVAGTSGKSTVTAMIFHILESTGFSSSLAAGANLASLRRRGLLGNAWKGGSDLLVMEADESDGTINRYRPWLGVLLNVTKDHKELPELHKLFAEFQSASRNLLVFADGAGVESYLSGAVTFGFSAGGLRARNLDLFKDFSRFSLEGESFRVPLPGRHNAENALAAAAACAEAGVTLAQSASALKNYEGISRRFERLGSARGVEVIDDFAHNPEKIRATLAAARLGCKRILAVFQLHGFAPARLMKTEFLQAFGELLTSEDRLWLPDIYYAGGTAAKDISAQDYALALEEKGLWARRVASRETIPDEVAAQARPGDMVLVMGARDPSLSELARAVLARLSL